MSKINLEKIKKVHFIGIGGIGISAIARMMALEGKTITANDLGEFELVTALREFGIDTKITADPDSIPKDAELVVYSIAWNKIAPELLESVKNTKIPMLSYPEVLGLVSANKFTIAISGTHGKTTTTAMIGKILIDAGLDPTIIVGSLLKDQKSNFVAGKSKYFVVEACEYKRSFLDLRPNIAVVLNIDDDHLDYYKNLEGIQAGFRDFLRSVKSGGVVVTDTSSEKIAPILENLTATIVDYHTLQAVDDGEIILKIPGRHNVQNAKAALVVALSVGVPKEKALASLEKFSGTWRRFDERGKTKNGALVYDDYGHHPTEIAATLAGARQKFPNNRIVVAFQPHLYSRTKEHFEEFGPAMSAADEIILLPIYAAREVEDPSVSSEILAEKMKKNGLNSRFFKNFESAAEYLGQNLKNGDVFITMGAGDINKLAEMMVK